MSYDHERDKKNTKQLEPAKTPPHIVSIGAILGYIMVSVLVIGLICIFLFLQKDSKICKLFKERDNSDYVMRQFSNVTTKEEFQQLLKYLKWYLNNLDLCIGKDDTKEYSKIYELILNQSISKANQLSSKNKA